MFNSSGLVYQYQVCHLRQCLCLHLHHLEHHHHHHPHLRHQQRRHCRHPNPLQQIKQKLEVMKWKDLNKYYGKYISRYGHIFILFKISM